MVQVVHGSSPYKELVNRFENDLIIAVGKGEPAAVMVDYGFRKVLSIDEYSSYFGDIDPLAPFKKWIVQQPDNINLMSEKVHPSYDVFEERVKGVFVVSDPVDWGRDLQVTLSMFRCFKRNLLVPLFLTLYKIVNA
jgi:hypothetical protein